MEAEGEIKKGPTALRAREALPFDYAQDRHYAPFLL